MKKISLNNFLKMSPDAPQYTDKNQHYSLSGVNPVYYREKAGTIEEQLAPLIASNTFKQITGLNVTTSTSDITDSTEGTYEAYCIDNNSNVYGINVVGNTLVQFGYPSGSIITSTLQKLKCFNGNLLVTNDFGVYRMPLPGSAGTWVNIGSLTDQFGKHPLETFLAYCMCAVSKSEIQKIDSAWSFTTGIDLGTGWNILGMKNYNDKYLAIAGANGQFIGNYLFLWDGISSRYNYSVKIPGKYLDMKVIDGILYVNVWMNGSGTDSSYGTTAIYYLSGTTLKQLITPQISPIDVIANRDTLFSFYNRIGLKLKSKDLLIYGKTEVGLSEFILGNTLDYNQFSESYDGFLIASAGKWIYYYDVTSTTFNPISYTSLWIPVKNLQGLDIYYDSPPSSGTDKISVTVYADGENIITGTQTITLDDITPTNHLNSKRTRLDVKGFAGDKCKIVLTTTNDGTWRPIIRQIDLITK